MSKVRMMRKGKCFLCEFTTESIMAHEYGWEMWNVTVDVWSDLTIMYAQIWNERTVYVCMGGGGRRGRANGSCAELSVLQLLDVHINNRITK
jgi:hypothetical protein